MKKLRTYILIFLALNVVSFNQFSKLPLLVAHYIDHWELDHSIGLGTFLDMHYLGHDINDHDDKKDKELPFKSFTLNSFQVFTLPACEMNFVIHPQFAPASIKRFIRGDQFVPTQVISNLFRPPRLAA